MTGGGEIGGHVARELVAAASRQAAFAGEPGELRYGRFVKALAWLQLPLVIFALAVLLFADHDGQLIPLLILLGMFGLGAPYTFLEGYVTKGSFDEQGITLRTPWSGRKQQRWADLERARFHPSLGYYSLAFRDGTTIRLSTLLGGHGTALEQLQHSTLVKVQGAPQRT